MHSYDYTKLIIRENGMILANQLYEISKNESCSMDSFLKEHMIKLAISIPSVIAEGHSKRNTKSLKGSIYSAKGLVAQLLTHLRIALMQQYLTEDQFDQIYEGYHDYLKDLEKIGQTLHIR